MWGVDKVFRPLGVRVFAAILLCTVGVACAGGVAASKAASGGAKYKINLNMETQIDLCGKLLGVVNAPSFKPSISLYYFPIADIPGVSLPNWHEADPAETNQLLGVLEDMYMKIYGGPGKEAQYQGRIKDYDDLKRKGSLFIYVSDPFDYDGIPGNERIVAFLGRQYDVTKTPLQHEDFLVVSEDLRAHPVWPRKNSGLVFFYQGRIYKTAGFGQAGGGYSKPVVERWQGFPLGRSALICDIQPIHRRAVK